MTEAMQGRLKLDAEQTEYLHMLMGVKAGASADSAPSSLPSETPFAMSCFSKHDHTRAARRCRPCQLLALPNMAHAQDLCNLAHAPASLLHSQ